MLTLVLSSASVGLLGSLHCAGMCGPLATGVACVRAHGTAPGRLAAFLAGKLVTYATLGAVAATVGLAFGGRQLGAHASASLALVVGVSMAGLGAHSLWRRLGPPREGRQGPRPPSAVGTLLGAALRARGAYAPLLAGALAGLLPCGLVWAMAARSAAAGPPWAGALVMAAFGLGTSPSLWAVAWVSRVASGRTRRYGEVLAATAVVLMGLLMLWRGASALLEPAGCPGCHHGV